MCRFKFNPFYQKKPLWLGKDFDFLKNNDYFDFHKSLDGYFPTPLIELKNLSKELGVKSIFVKDESHRFGIKAFKALGASYAIFRFLKKQWESSYDTEFTTQSFNIPMVLSKLGSFTFCAATDGNHGKAVAWTARKLHQKAIIFMPEASVKARIDSIKNEGAEVIIVKGTYDDCVKEASLESKKHGWIEISDTAYPGYTEIPSWVLNGYTTIFRELEDSLNTPKEPLFDYIFLQAGVGAFAASASSYYTMKYQEKRPDIIIVEPIEAACFLDSIEAGTGKPIAAKGKMETIMAGLNCGIPSICAWPIIRDSANVFLGISDEYAEKAIKAYFSEEIISGESGAAGLGGLIALLTNPNLKECAKRLEFNENSRILLINTEGDTDPINYRKIISNLK